MDIYDFHRGRAPLLISIPHAGTEVPAAIMRRLTAAGRPLPDTDWHVDRLYEFARDLGASIIKANHSRYVVDLNRAPVSVGLYAEHPTSPVCPLAAFSGQALYASGDEPDEREVMTRIEQYWRPYHDRIAQELARIRQEAGIALLWDAHSVASEVPGLFAGVLPEFNLGTRDNASCPSAIAEALLQLLIEDGKFGAVLNGRFKGGYITMNYGRPQERAYAVQLELAQRVYMDEGREKPWHAERASTAIGCIERLLRTYIAMSRDTK